MANNKQQQLNITCKTDVVLHDRLIFDGETFDPSLSVGIVANLVTSMGKRNPLDVEVDGDELVISIPWVEGRNPGCYGLEVTGICNSKKWSTYADSLIRYTKATKHGASEVTVESDYYDITMEVGYRYGEGGNVNDVLVNGESVVQAGKARITVPTKVSDLENDADYATQEDVEESKISEVEATIDDNVGTPEVEATLTGHKLILAFQNLLGDGIASIEQTTTSEESEGVNVVTVTTIGGKVGTFQIRNGKKGDTVILGEGVVYILYNGTGHNTDGAMTQHAATNAFGRLTSVATDVPDVDVVLPLPQEYTLLDYIENTVGDGGAYIDMGLVPTDANWEFEGWYIVKNVGQTSQPVFGNYASNVPCYGLGRYSTSTTGVFFAACCKMNNTSSRDTNRGWSLNTKYNFKIYVASGAAKLNINGNVTNGASAYTTGITSNHMLLFKSQASSYCFIGQMGRFKAKHNGQLVMDLAPCKKTVEGVEVFGMFDRVSRVFYTSASETPFTYTENN